ncbi:hypothetical protein [Lentzea sp. NBRC 105346]|uniref:hypothetical protein n=1 Tax=Lentzea sp. NBRC 105346 TaxID=3032205 RepID=UPI0025569579|nr:hypothetical protein [Lentzea sp. NBRC 105346]
MIGVAVLLLLKSNLFAGDKLSADDTKSLWTFLGVAFGIVGTLIGALLTAQHNHRTHILAEQVKIQEQELARETEERLKVDTVAKILELVTVDGGYAPRARVAGAIATLMQLHGGAVSIRILGELWAADAVDSSTAVWLIDRTLRDSSATEDETGQAADVLALQVKHLVPSHQDIHQEWCHWPKSLTESWPSDMAFGTRNALIAAVTQILLVRELAWWELGALRTPVRTMVNALHDPELGKCSALILKTLLDSGALKTVRLSEDDTARINTMSSSVEPTAWFRTILDKLGIWASGQPTEKSIVPASTLGPSPLTSKKPRSTEDSELAARTALTSALEGKTTKSSRRKRKARGASAAKRG